MAKYNTFEDVQEDFDKDITKYKNDIEYLLKTEYNIKSGLNIKEIKEALGIK